MAVGCIPLTRRQMVDKIVNGKTVCQTSLRRLIRYKMIDLALNSLNTF